MPPVRPPHPCNAPACGALTQERFCPAHKRQANIARGSSAERGYDRRWRKLRDWVLRHEPLCRECWKAGRVTAATEVHHIIAKSQGGTDDADNLEPTCKPCHVRLTPFAGAKQ